MTDVRDTLLMLAAAELAEWRGLAARVPLVDVAAVLPVEDGPTGTDLLGEDRRPVAWSSVESEVYEGGLRVWHEDGLALLLEGRDPVDSTGEPMQAPDLGEAEALLDSVLGRVFLPGGERVFAARGLALRVNPENGLLLGVLGFAPTTVEDYRVRLRPELPPQRLLPDPASHGSAA